MRPTSVTCTATNTGSQVSNPIILDWRNESGFNVSVRVVPNSNITYSVEYTHDNIIDGSYGTNGTSATWVTAPSSTGLESIATGTTPEIGAIAFPCTAIRLKGSTATGTGTAVMTVVQGG